MYIYIEENALRELRVNIDDNYTLVLYKSWYTYVRDPEVLIESICDLFRAQRLKVSVSDAPHTSKDERATLHSAICIWNGTDDKVPKMINSFRFESINNTMVKDDPKTKSIWSVLDNMDMLVVPTNGCYKDAKNGKSYASMSSGLALQANLFIDNISPILGNKIKQLGNRVHSLGKSSAIDALVLAFPVKPGRVVVNENKTNIIEYKRETANPNDELPGYYHIGDKELISKSFDQLCDMLESDEGKNIRRLVMPTVGCGFNELSWDDDLVPMIKSNERLLSHKHKIYVMKGSLMTLEESLVPSKQYGGSLG